MLNGDIDHHSSEEIRRRTDELIGRYMPSRLTLDFSQVSFCDSSGIAVVLGRYKIMKANGGTVELTGVNHQISRIFELSGIWNLVDQKEADYK